MLAGSMVSYYQSVNASARKFADCLSQPCEKEFMGSGWSCADVREGFKGEWLVCCRHGRRFPLGMDGLLLMCETVSIGYRLSVVAVRDGVHGLLLLCCRSARRFPRGVIGLS